MVEGLPFHILQRGNNRTACFVEDEDRASYLFHLRRNLRPAECLLHAYCLMTNHVHLLVTPMRVDSCATLMKAVNQLHTQYINRRYGRTGTLWEGRFKSSAIEAETYLLNCYRYIELNPVRAAIVPEPAYYPWSSFRANVGQIADPFLTPHDEFLRLGNSEAARLEAYIEFVGQPNADAPAVEIRKAASGNFALGSTVFSSQLGARTGGRASPGGKGGRPRKERGGVLQLPLPMPAK